MIQEKIRYTKTGKRIEVYEFKAKLHQKVVMSKNQFEEHIFPKHPEISLEIIKEVLENPDFVMKGPFYDDFYDKDSDIYKSVQRGERLI